MPTVAVTRARTTQAGQPLPVANVPPGRIRDDATGLSVPYFASRPLVGANDGILRAVIVLHDHHRDAAGAVRGVVAAADAAGKDGEAIVLAPQFLTEPDVRVHSPGKNIAFWSGGWKQGDHSLPTPGRAAQVTVSSFTAVDAIMASLANTRTFPDLRLTVVAGHSAGGQFVHRYAAANPEPVTTHYVVANPSSYLYLDGDRPSSTGAENPCDGAEPHCPGHDRYRYGLAALNAYMSALGPDAIRNRYRQRRVTYLLGLEDDDPEHPELDRSCAARAQGLHRLERGNAYIDHLRRHYGPDVVRQHTRVHVPGVGHCGEGMFSAPQGLSALFPPLPDSRPAARAVAETTPR